MNAELQFTRYLYEKTEVEVTLITSILNKSDESLFWATELFHSGFELNPLLWSMYYDFFASLNPSFEKYLLVKLKGVLTMDVLCLVVNNFMIRPHNSDVFILRNIVREFELEDETQRQDLFEKKDLVGIAKLVYESDADELLGYVVGYFGLNEKKVVADFQKVASDKVVSDKVVSDKRVVLLSRIVNCFAQSQKKRMGKNIFIESEDVKPVEEMIPRKTLAAAALYNIDSNNYLSLFQLPRDKSDIRSAYLDNWLYHAATTPIWSARIKEHNGTIKEKDVVFASDDDLEQFHELYGLEPDEQKKEVQDKSLQAIETKRTWSSFYNEHKNRSVIDVAEYISEFDKIYIQ